MPNAFDALIDVIEECKRQDAKWGEQNHMPAWWLAILGEEFGEACQAALHANFGGPEAENYHKEMVHVAAVALQAIECFDRAERTAPATDNDCESAWHALTGD